jgi:3-hydroxyacyl-CoA dehydrogenase/enoyl-CoA hydratase/3-hydroxybutyryl-CoA epimerase/enoyl-CoA isomerase
MKYDGQAIQCLPLPEAEGFAELRFDLAGDSVNKFNAQTLKELREAVDLLKAEKGLKGVLLTSGKECFIVGADVTEFLQHFQRPEAEMVTWIGWVNRMFNDLEDLECPSVVAVNGVALGGGFEVCLAASYRVMASDTKVGLPETKLGIFPGWGGTVRLSRLAGADNAIEWIASGEQWGAADALKIGAVDGVVEKADLRASAVGVLLDAAAGGLDWKKRQAVKKGPLTLDKIESLMVFETSKAFVGGKAGPNYPSPVAAIEAIEKGARKNRDEALPIETEAFVKVARGPVAAALVSVFLGDQLLKKFARKHSKAARKIESAAVLGAGIMGGGIAYVSASKRIPILMKDIAPKAIDLGLQEACKLLDKQVSRGKMTPGKMAETLGRIRPTLSYGDFGNVDFVVEAVVENEKVKKSVLAEVEGALKPGAVLASNTSTISITRLAEALKRPEDFCGMHFFNPVPRMPLVEIIRGAKSSPEAIATAVSYAQAMGKTPVVVNDCAGFLVNRVLFPYFAGFMKLVEDGVDFTRIDKAMEKWGWPMGPAFLLDVVGIDTAVHADKVMAAAFPDRMAHTGETASEVMFKAQRFGQKNGKGFFIYKPEKKGPPKKSIDPEVAPLLAPIMKGDGKAVTDQEIVERMMLPMLLECSRCLEDKIVDTPVEVDLSLVYGLGFPPFRGGIFRWADSLGAKALVETSEKYAKLGKLYEPTAQLRALATAGKTFHVAG